MDVNRHFKSSVKTHVVLVAVHVIQIVQIENIRRLFSRFWVIWSENDSRNSFFLKYHIIKTTSINTITLFSDNNYLHYRCAPVSHHMVGKNPSADSVLETLDMRSFLYLQMVVSMTLFCLNSVHVFFKVFTQSAR